MILTPTLCMAIMIYHESRSATIHEQQLVAQVAQNRVAKQRKAVCGVVMDARQFSWAKKYKIKYHFVNNHDVMKYYNLTDGDAWITAVGVASLSSLPTSSAYYYHDKSISKQSYSGVLVANTKYFCFYREK